MDMNLTSADVESIVKTTLMKSALGDIISKKVNSLLQADRYNNPIDESLKAFVVEIAKELIKEKFADQIREIILTVIEQKITKETIQTTVDAAVQKMQRAAEGY